ncbi:diacylglycerol kinase epsilon [Aethina tumida]|uniref:diacylglycerol kinase epsilon n=1 Tax=Aethina tumida TaxID=116153 RepID=UPI00096B19AA|nr:diacylglycerol kinase epsilon [Aethina tumida]
MTMYSKFMNSETNNNTMWLFTDLIPPMNIPIIITGIVMCCVGLFLIKKLSVDSKIPVRDSSKTHNWSTIKLASKPWYCSICDMFLITGIGVFCDCCGVCACSEDVKKANQKFPCKMVTSTNDTQLHHWVKGNLPLGSHCYICEEECCVEPGLNDYQCCWCQRTVHTECLDKMGQVCDFGAFKNMIVPPYCVQVARRKGALHKHLLLRAVRDPGWENWTPLIVIGNKKSGNSDGATVLSEFRKYLNPVQVIDLSERKPPAALQWCVLLAPRPVKFLVAGGDGTIAWVLTSSHKMDLDPEPEIAIMPLGTGNDLSRVLGWGKANSSDFDIVKLLKDIQSSKKMELDRWKIELTSTRHLGLRIPTKTLYMYNYISVGVDAQVALNFHKTRQSIFYIYGSRIFNKLLYLCFGTHQVVNSDCKNLEKRLDLFLDGKQIDLPELESIVILNISSWGAGVNLWRMGSQNGKSNQSHCDGILEVVGIYSSFHIAQLQVGLSTPLRLGQAKHVEIRIKSKVPIQIDGEPFEQHPSTLQVTYTNRCSVLVNQKRNA